MDITVTARLVLVDVEDNDDEDAIAGGDEKAKNFEVFSPLCSRPLSH